MDYCDNCGQTVDPYECHTCLRHVNERLTKAIADVPRLIHQAIVAERMSFARLLLEVAAAFNEADAKGDTSKPQAMLVTIADHLIHAPDGPTAGLRVTTTGWFPNGGTPRAKE